MKKRHAERRLTDDAGRSVSVLERAGLTEWPVKGDPRIAGLAQRIRRAITRWPPDMWLFFLGAIVVLAAIGWLIVSVWPAASAYMSLVFMAGMQIVGFGCWRFRLNAGAKQVVRLVLQEGLCPCCGYNFVGLNIEDVSGDRLVVCPECGSSWRRERIQRVAAFAPGSTLGLPTKLIQQPAGIGSSWRTKDDAGTPVHLVHPWLMKPLDFPSSRDHRARLLSAKAAIAKSGRTIRLLISIPLIVAAVLIVPTVAMFGSIHWIPHAFGLAIVCFVVGMLARFANFAYSASEVRETMLDQDLCPGCGADIGGIAPGSMGLVICGGCHAEWSPHRAAADRPCPGCGYAMRGLPTGADRDTVCPECGAEWRLAERATSG